MDEEIAVLHKNNTWTLVLRQSEDNIIGTKWIFWVKTKEYGSIDMYKTRLVTNDMRQVYGVDYLDTFNLVVQPLSIRLVLGLVVSNGWSIHQIDVSNAFLHGELNERIVFSQPLGFRDSSHPNKVCLLRKSLYGLKQSPHCWFKKLRQVLKVWPQRLSD